MYSHIANKLLSISVCKCDIRARKNKTKLLREEGERERVWERVGECERKRIESVQLYTFSNILYISV